jgi:hypothetical protein
MSHPFYMFDLYKVITREVYTKIYQYNIFCERCIVFNKYIIIIGSTALGGPWPPLEVS